MVERKHLPRLKPVYLDCYDPEKTRAQRQSRRREGGGGGGGGGGREEEKYEANSKTLVLCATPARCL